jgi:hypothetical protein
MPANCISFTGVNILICRSLIRIHFSNKSTQNWFRLFSAFDSLVCSAFKKLPIDCQHTCALKRHQRCKGMFIFMNYLKTYIRYLQWFSLLYFTIDEFVLDSSVLMASNSFRFGYHIWKSVKFSITLSKM